MVESQVEVMDSSWVGVSGWGWSQVSSLMSGSGVSHNVESQVGVGVLSQGLGSGSGLESRGWVSGRVPRSGSSLKLGSESRIEVGCQGQGWVLSRGWLSGIDVEVEVLYRGRGQVGQRLGSRSGLGLGSSRVYGRGWGLDWVTD
ncbi:hypothetical protein KY290_037341 [Solanum tuberosum]|uniref:Uncharacterized protein n=1 Tax=Solanum tuberosum TaxID=4113 RepID=A0ABQ7TVQ7_SOLTU|nr:hypothetical protein KY285_036640 [Solanum tuberosum]KAH0738636.1 hypothetical protein KY290_037341 [Solanum tuberosum]